MAFSSKLRQILKQRWRPITLAILGCALIFIIVAGYWPTWTRLGFSNKTLWDWMQLFIVPALLTLGAAWFASRQNHDREIAREQHEHDTQIAVDNQREVALQGYIDHMSELLLEKNLRASKPDDEVRNIASVRTLTAFSILDPRRKRNILQFLKESGLLNKGKDAWNQWRDQYRDIEPDLRGISLKNVRLTDFNFSNTDFDEASLIETNFSGADLKNANLYHTFLTRSNFSYSDFETIPIVVYRDGSRKQERAQEQNAQLEEGRAPASRQKIEEEQVNQREETQPPEHTKIPPKPADDGWLLTPTTVRFAAKRAYQTAIFDKRMPCITAQTIDETIPIVV